MSQLKKQICFEKKGKKFNYNSVTPLKKGIFFVFQAKKEIKISSTFLLLKHLKFKKENRLSENKFDSSFRKTFNTMIINWVEMGSSINLDHMQNLK